MPEESLAESLLKMSQDAVDNMNILPSLKEEFKKRLETAARGESEPSDGGFKAGKGVVL